MGSRHYGCSVQLIVRGHSAASRTIIEAILKLIRIDFTPVIPYRGTVSASGDLMPLAYIGGTVEGSPDVWVRTRTETGCRVVSAKDALAAAQIAPVQLGPKEGLAIVNGTSPSAAVASLALYETHQLAVLSQVLTAMTVEGLQGNSESFHPFIAKVKPHPGQTEAAANIRSFLSGSTLAKNVVTDKVRKVIGLAQDRYALRSAPQSVDFRTSNPPVQAKVRRATRCRGLRLCVPGPSRQFSYPIGRDAQSTDQLLGAYFSPVYYAGGRASVHDMCLPFLRGVPSAGPACHASWLP